MERLAFYRMQVEKLQAKRSYALALAHINRAIYVDDPDAKSEHYERALKLLAPDALVKGGASTHVASARAVNRELRANVIALRRFEAEAKKQADEKANGGAA